LFVISDIIYIEIKKLNLKKTNLNFLSGEKVSEISPLHLHIIFSSFYTLNTSITTFNGAFNNTGSF